MNFFQKFSFISRLLMFDLFCLHFWQMKALPYQVSYTSRKSQIFAQDLEARYLCISIIPDRNSKNRTFWDITWQKSRHFFNTFIFLTRVFHHWSGIDSVQKWKHLIFAFDFSAAVARMNKFYNVPLLTAGGFTYNFNEPKQSFDNEFHLLIKTGQSFEDMVDFMFKFYKR